MESNKLKNIVPFNIEIVSIDPDHSYSSESEYEDSDYSDSGSETESRNYADDIGQGELNISKNTEVRPTSEPQSSESQLVTDSAQIKSYTSKFDERNANDTTPTTDATTPKVPTSEAPTSTVLTPKVPTPKVPTPKVPTPKVPTPKVPTPKVPTPKVSTPELPTPELPTPELPTPELPTPELPTTELPTPELPTPELPTPELPTPELPTPELSTPELPTPEISTPEISTPEVPTLEVSTPELPTTSEELDSEPLDEPVEMIDGLFDFVTFNTDTDVVLKEVEQDGKDFDLEAYVTDQSESPTSASQESGASSASSSPGNSVSPILPPQEIESNNTKVNTPVSNIGFGKGQGKNFAALMKCYNKDKPVFQKSKEDTENTKKSLAKSLKDNELKAPKDVKMAEEKDLKPVKLEDYKPVKEKQARLVKKKDVKPIKIENAEPTKEKLFKVKDLQPANEQGMKLLKQEKVKSDRENKLKPVKVEVKPCKENKERIGEKITKKMGNHSSEQKVHSSAQTSTNNAQDVSDKLDDFAKAIVASMVVAHRKPNLEKRRNSEMRKRLCHFQEHSLKFQKYLSDQREPPKMNVLHPTTNAINMNSKTPSQLQQSTGNTSSVALKTRPQQQQKIKTENCAQIVNANTVELKATPYQNVKIENCSPTGNSNNADWKTQQQQQNIKSENCAPTDHTETPAGARKISIQEYLNRKRSYHSSNNGSDVGNDSNIPTKKRISINEYMKRKVVA